MRGGNTLKRNESPAPRILHADIRRVRREHMLLISFADARVLGLPLTLFPALAIAKPAERNNIELIARGHGLRWPQLDLDLSASGLLAGNPEFAGSAKRVASERRLKDYFRSLQAFASKSLAG